MLKNLKNHLYRLLRWSEKYTKTDMVYVTKNSFWVNAHIGVTSLLAFLLSVAFANILSPYDIGIYQYLITLGALLTALTYTGYNTTITRSVAQGFEGTLRASIKPQLLWNIVPMMLGMAVSVYYLLQGNILFSVALSMIALALPFTQTLNSYVAYLNGKKDFQTTALFGIAVSITYHGAMFFALFLFPNVLLLVVINALVTLAATALVFCLALKKYMPRGETDKEAPKTARHLTFINGITMVSNYIDSILVFQFLGPAQLALYTIAKILPEKIGGFFKSLSLIAIPKFSENETSTTAHKARRFFIVGAVIALVAGAYMLIAPFVFSIFYPLYTDGIAISQALALLMFVHLVNIRISALTANGKFHTIYAITIVNSIFQIIAILAGILLAGLWGLVIAKIIATIFYILISSLELPVLKNGIQS